MSADAASTPWDLLARRLAGEATPAEAAVVRAWAAATPENAALWRQLSGVWAETAAAAPTTPVFTAADTAHAWQRFEAQVMGPPPPNAPSTGPSASPGAPPAGPLSVPGATGAMGTLGGMAGLGKVAALLVAGASAGWLLRTAIPAASDTAQQRPAQTVAMAPTPAASAPTPAGQNGAAPVDLVFEETPLAEVAQRLERTFGGTHVVITDSALARQRFTGTFQAARPVVVLRVASLAAGATLTHRSDSTWVVSRGSE